MTRGTQLFAKLGVSCCLAAFPASGMPPGFENLEIVELTHTLDSNFPFIPVPGVTFPFGLTPIATIDANGVAANRWTIHEHLGTQIDAPNHFAKNGGGLEGLTASNLIVPMAVIDFRESAARDVDAALGVDDILQWEAQNGRVPDGAVVILYTGWDARIGDAAAYINPDESGTKHFPGFSPDAASWLVTNRNIWGIGVDTLSFDPGSDNDYRTHKALLGAGKWAIEAVANLQSVPPLGATLFVGAPRVRDATGGPVRLIALRPKSPSFDARRLRGVWRSGTAQRVDRTDGSSVYVVREFTFDRDRWRLVFTVSEDAGGASKIFSGDFGGSYAIESYVPLVHAYGAQFSFSQRRITAYQPDLVRTLDAAGCGAGAWVAGESQDVDETGCAVLRVYPRSQCDREYDLIDLIGNELHFGSRPDDGDLCTEARRPHRLADSGLRKK